MHSGDINIDSWCETHGKTSLIQEDSENKEEIIKQLITQGAKVNLAANNGMTALMRATSRGDTEIEALLKRYGAK